NIPENIREALFGKNCKFVPTPSKNAYDQLDEIEKECLEQIPNNGKYKIIITSMGCAGRALQKRLWNKLDNVFLFDFGSLMDALCGQAKYVRMWIRYSNFDGKSFLKKLIQANNPPGFYRVKQILSLLTIKSISLARKGWLNVDFDTSMGKETKDYADCYKTFLEKKGQEYHPCINMKNSEVMDTLRKISGHNNPSSRGIKNNGKIPKIIHQICLEPDLPQRFKPFQKKLMELHPDWEYQLWKDDDIAQLVETISPENQKAFYSV
ncbi:unnamed protein product, partial [marine sediment metagenome]